MDVFIGIVAFIFILGVIVLVHEGGHYLFARRAGILAREFAFGMGPQLWKKKKGETVYSIRAFPIGGFCAIAGEELEDDPLKDHPQVKLDVINGIVKGIYFKLDDESNKYPVYDIVSYDIFDEKQTGNLYMIVSRNGETLEYKVDPQAMLYLPKEEYQIAPYNRTLGSKSKRARAMVMFGGPLMNILLAIIAFFIAGLLQGFPNYDSSVITGMEETENLEISPAYEAGLRNGDIITNLKSGDLEVSVSEWNHISEFMDSYTSDGKVTPILVTYKRDNVEKTAEFLPVISFYSIAAIGKVVYENNNILGIKVVAITNADDNGNMNNMELYQNDIITEVEGKPIIDLDAVFDVFYNYVGETNLERVDMKVLRYNESNNINEINEIKVQPYNKELMEYQLSSNGIPTIKVQMVVSPSIETNLLESIKYGFERTYVFGTAVFKTLGMLFSKTISITSLTSFIGIGGITIEIVKGGLANLLNWMGVLSVNIGVMNLLPIPALDGGRLVFLGYEAITNKKPNQKVETILISVTMMLLFGLMIFISIKDIINLFK